MEKLLNNFLLPHRSQEEEELDSLELHASVLYKVLGQLGLLNKLLGNTRLIVNAVQKQLSKIEFKKGEAVRIVDLASGGGDVTLAIARKLKQLNVEHNIVGIDFNSESISYAESKLRSDDLVQFINCNIMDDDFLLPECDLLISTQFVYHFKDEELSMFLEKVKSRVSHSIIFSELRRSSLAHFLFGLSRFLPFHRIIRMDGKKAIRRAFSKKDWHAILNEVTNVEYILKDMFPFRYEIIIETNA